MDSEYQRLNSSSTTSSLMSSSKYSKAIFTEIPDFFDISSTEDNCLLECRLYLSDDVISSSDDVIVVRKLMAVNEDLVRPLAVISVKDLVVCSEEGFGERAVRIGQDQLRDKDQLMEQDQFFQMVYLRRNNEDEEVLGASVPFRFRRVAQEEYEDFFVVSIRR